MEALLLIPCLLVLLVLFILAVALLPGWLFWILVPLTVFIAVVRCLPPRSKTDPHARP